MIEDAAPSEGLSRLPSVFMAIAAWLVPGLGHWLLRRRFRALLYLVLVTGSAVVGTLLHGKLYAWGAGGPFSALGALASTGSGLIYGALQFLLGYRGDVLSRGFEYGTAYLVTAGLMNWLLVLDVWDRSRGLVRVTDRPADETAHEEES